MSAARLARQFIEILLPPQHGGQACRLRVGASTAAMGRLWLIR
jgi:hypothetical protein